jgi:CDP-diacylglycerol--glycerol-3-phosphate 3-phosphatidyltransferase
VTRTATLGRVKHGYSYGTRKLLTQPVASLARTRVTPNALTSAGVALCIVAAVLIPFEHRNELLVYWLAATLFVIGSLLDILDGELARRSGKSTPFGAFLDSLSDRVSEGFVIGAIALVFARHGQSIAATFCVAATAASFLVSYARAKTELIGFRGDIGLGGRAERVALIAAGLFLAPWGFLPWAIYAVTAIACFTVLQRILHVRRQLLLKGTDGFDER